VNGKNKQSALVYVQIWDFRILLADKVSPMWNAILLNFSCTCTENVVLTRYRKLEFKQYVVFKVFLRAA